MSLIEIQEVEDILVNSFELLNQQKQRESSDMHTLKIYVDDGDINTSENNMDIISLNNNMDVDQTDDSVMFTIWSVNQVF